MKKNKLNKILTKLVYNPLIAMTTGIGTFFIYYLATQSFIVSSFVGLYVATTMMYVLENDNN